MAPSRRRVRLVTLSTDFGSAYAAQVKGVLAHRLPPGHVVELSHDLPRGGISEAAFVVRAMASAFPPGTVHLIVIDPGVGGDRRPVVVRCADGSVLVGPDNGVLFPLAKQLGPYRAVRIDRPPRGTRPRVGTTFDGRDLFAPVAALLARGAPIRGFGPPHRLTVRPLPDPEGGPGRFRGEVVHVDRFGNLITNVPTEWVRPRGGRVRLRLGRVGRSLPFVTSYEAIGAGRLGALGSSFGTLEIAVAGASAADRLRGRIGLPVAGGDRAPGGAPALNR